MFLSKPYMYTFNDYNHYIYFTTCIQLANGLSTHLLHSFKFTLVNKSHLCGYCLRHFLILYACVHKVSFPDQKTTVNGLEARLVTKWPAGSTLGWHGLFPHRRGVKKMYYRDGVLPICWPLLSCIIPPLFVYFLTCYPFIFLQFFKLD